MRILVCLAALALGCGAPSSLDPGVPGAKSEQNESVSDRWQAFSDYFNTFEDLAGDHHWFVYRFGTKSAGDLGLQEEQAVTRMCGQDGLTNNPVTTTQLSEGEFTSSALPELIKNVMLATEDESADSSEQQELRDQTVRLTIFLTQLASQAQTIWNVGSSGDCQGHWGHDHWVLQSDRWTASVSLGGGE